MPPSPAALWLAPHHPASNNPPTCICPDQLHCGGAHDEQGPVLRAKAGRNAQRLRARFWRP
jgi:hypothetical protein